VLRDPYEYFEEMRGKCPVHQLADRDIVMVTGFQETIDVLNNPDTFSSVIAPGGPVVPLPFEPDGDDIDAQVAAHHGEIALSDLLVALDDQPHRYARAIMNRLFVPSRLKANEAYIEHLADTMVRDVVAKGGCELINEVSTPFVTLMIADLLGVPEGDREQFRSVIDANAVPGNMNVDDGATTTSNPLEFMAGFFVRYLMERRAAPGDDVLSELAQATYPDRSEPDVIELVKLATFLFGAGQDTSAKLLGNCFRFLVEDRELRQQLRDDRSLIPAFFEEVLRLKGSSKVTFRIARKKTRIGEVEVPAGKRIVLALAAANRDPRRWENPAAFGRAARARRNPHHSRTLSRTHFRDRSR
jgi:cytochrome P450